MCVCKYVHEVMSTTSNIIRQAGQKLNIAFVVSVGSGIFPTEDLGKTDAQQFLYFGKHWLKAGHDIKARAKSLMTLLTTAVSRFRACNVYVILPH